MDSHEDRMRYYDTLHKMVYNTIPPYLRMYFICLWNKKFSEAQWQSNSKSGEILVKKIVENLKTVSEDDKRIIEEWIEHRKDMSKFEGDIGRKPKAFKKTGHLLSSIEKLMTGNENTWDISVLAYILNDSGLKLVIPGSRVKQERREPLHTSEVIERIRLLRNEVVAHASTTSCEYKIYEQYQNIEDETMIAVERELGKGTCNKLRKITVPIQDSMLSKDEVFDDKSMQDIDRSRKILQDSQNLLDEERKNFQTITKSICEIIPIYLRKLFIENWNDTYPDKAWKSDKTSGRHLCRAIPKKIRYRKHFRMHSKLLKSGKVETWDFDVLIFVMLYSRISLLLPCRTAIQRNLPLRVSEQIERIKTIKNKHFEQLSSMQCSSADFERIMTDLKSIAACIFHKDAVNDLKEIELALRSKEIKGTSKSIEDGNELEDNLFMMDEEKGNFVKLSAIVFEVIPKHLRRLFIQSWDSKFPDQKWQSNSISGNCFFRKLPDYVKINRRNNIYFTPLKNGNENCWDTDALVFSMLYSGLDLFEACRPNVQRKNPLRISEEIEKFRQIRHSLFSNECSMSLSYEYFTDFLTKIKIAAKRSLCKDAEIEIDMIAESWLEMTPIVKVSQEALCGQLAEDVKELKRDVKGIMSKLELKPPDNFFKMDEEKENFVKLSAITFHIVPKYLRRLIIKCWDKKYPNEKWKSDSTFGSCIISKLPDDIKANSQYKRYINSLKRENEEGWNTATLCFVMLAPSLDLVEVLQTNGENNTSSTTGAIETLRDNGISFFSKRNSISCSRARYDQEVTEIKDLIRNLFIRDAEQEIDMVGNVRFEMKNKGDLIQHLAKELEEIAQSVNELRRDVKVIINKLESKPQDRRTSPLDMREIPDYKCRERKEFSKSWKIFQNSQLHL